MTGRARQERGVRQAFHSKSTVADPGGGVAFLVLPGKTRRLRLGSQPPGRSPRPSGVPSCSPLLHGPVLVCVTNRTADVTVSLVRPGTKTLRPPRWPAPSHGRSCQVAGRGLVAAPGLGGSGEEPPAPAKPTSCLWPVTAAAPGTQKPCDNECL